MHLHEIGHNMKLHHAGQYKGEEYNDASSAMGYCCSTRCFNFIHSWQLGFAEYTANSDLSVSTLEAASTSIVTSVILPELGSNHASGVKMSMSNGKSLVLSYRGNGGFDTILSTHWSGQVHVHMWEGSKQTDSQITHLMVQARPGDTHAIPETSLKLSVQSRVTSNTAEVLVCKNDNSKNSDSTLTECQGTSTGPSPTGAPTQAPTQNPDPIESPVYTPIWTNYVSYKQVNSDHSTSAMVGLGCKGDYCSQVKTGHRSDIKVRSTSSTWESIATGVGSLECPGDHVVSEIRCLGTDCDKHVIECAAVMGGSMLAHTTAYTSWFPKKSGDEESQLCSNGMLVTGVHCGGTKCAQKQLICQTFEASSSCVPACGRLSLQCGDDGCGGSCGTCKTGENCLPSVGQCMQEGLQ